MQNSGEPINPQTPQNGASSLPLFRPEAIAHQQQKSYGQIILIRPLSLTLLSSLAVAIVATAVGLLTFAHYTESARLHGLVVVGSQNATGSLLPELQAELYVPSHWLARIQPGQRLVLRCPHCPFQVAEQIATVRGISDAPLISPEVSSASRPFEPKYKVTVSLPLQPAQISHPLQTGMNVEAEIPLGRKPLIKWFFDRSGS